MKIARQKLDQIKNWNVCILYKNLFFSKNVDFLKFDINRKHLPLKWFDPPHGVLSQWGLSNKPRIRPGTVKSLNAPWELSYSQTSDVRNYAKKIDPCRMLVWLGRRSVQNMVIGSGQYTLLSGRPVQTWQVLFEFKFTTAQSAPPPESCSFPNQRQ